MYRVRWGRCKVDVRWMCGGFKVDMRWVWLWGRCSLTVLSALKIGLCACSKDHPPTIIKICFCL